LGHASSIVGKTHTYGLIAQEYAGLHCLDLAPWHTPTLRNELEEPAGQTVHTVPLCGHGVIADRG
jgi:hypothetical protein